MISNLYIVVNARVKELYYHSQIHLGIQDLLDFFSREARLVLQPFHQPQDLLPYRYLPCLLHQNHRQNSLRLQAFQIHFEPAQFLLLILYFVVVGYLRQGYHHFHRVHK